jgi:solute carrier family 13 (sodium-dependent dicarboxylate transporter), member 2/3/5
MTTHMLPSLAAGTTAGGKRRRPMIGKPRVLSACLAAGAAPLIAPIGIPLVTRATISVFVVMLVCSGFTKIAELRLALGAVAALVAIGATSVGDVASKAVGGTMWLLISSFLIAAAAASAGLAERIAVVVAGSATTVRGLFTRINAMLIVTAFLVPSTAGRAALMVPVFHAIASRIESAQVRRALAVMFPVGILLSAVASLLGAGAHIVTAEFVDGLGGQRLDMIRWATLGAPFAAASCYTAQTVVLRLFVHRDDVATPIDLSLLSRPAPGRAQVQTMAIVVAVVTMWLTESFHGVPAWLAAVVGAALLTAPRVGVTSLRSAIGQVPWTVLALMVVTVEVGTALARTGAADWIATSLLGPVVSIFGGGVAIVVAIAVLSLMSHLVITSRTARASVLIPIVVLVGGAANLDLTAVAFLSSAAAGYCLSSTSSAKPMMVFSRVGEDAYGAQDLTRLSLRLAPVQFGLLIGFSYGVWPALGMPLHDDSPVNGAGPTPTVSNEYPWAPLVIDDLTFGPRWDVSPAQGSDATPGTSVDDDEPPTTIPPSTVATTESSPTTPDTAFIPEPTMAPTSMATTPVTVPISTDDDADVDRPPETGADDPVDDQPAPQESIVTTPTSTDDSDTDDKADDAVSDGDDAD